VSAPLARHESLAPSAWIERWSHLVPSGGRVLDVACGSGRHVRWFADRGSPVTAIDRDAAALEPLRAIATVIVADIEQGPWPVAGEHFDAVVVTNYLWRPLMPQLIAALARGGVLLYETFAVGNETIGRPANPDFLLRPGELLDRARGLRVVAYEDGFEPEPPRFVQRIAAVREPAAGAQPPRHRLRP
jgi:SAM-dependent methyltransferase